MTDDALGPLVEALRRSNRDLRERVEELEDRVASLEASIEPDPVGGDYDSLDRDDKVLRIRYALLRRALERDGRASFTYGGVRAMFGDEPSPGHAYDLMRWAGEMAGYEYEERDDAMNRLVVDAHAVNDDRVVSLANNETSSGEV